MDRRTFIGTAIGTGAAAAATVSPLARAATAGDSGFRHFEVVTTVDLPVSSEQTQLWLPVLQSAGDYQRAQAPGLQGNGTPKSINDATFRASLVHAQWSADEGARHLVLTQQVAVRGRSAAPSHARLGAADRRLWTAPAAGMPLDGIVYETAQRIVSGIDSPHASVPFTTGSSPTPGVIRPRKDAALVTPARCCARTWRAERWAASAPISTR